MNLALDIKKPPIGNWGFVATEWRSGGCPMLFQAIHY